MVKSNKYVIKVISFLLAMLCLCSSTVFGQAKVAQAAMPETAVPYFTTISSTTHSINISGIKATCTATVRSQKSTTLKLKMELQKKKSGVYSTVKTWEHSKTGTSLSASESRNINILYDYRLKTTFTAGSESTVSYAYP